MRNLFKYLPLEWRLRDEYNTPQGPNFKRASSVTIPIAGSHLRFRAPRHRPFRSSVEQARLLPGQDVLEGRTLSSYGTSTMANESWGVANPLIRDWAFWGPWMTGCKAQLSMAVSVIGRFGEFALDDISYFHPRAFEMVLVNYLNDYYGHKRWGGINDRIPRYYGPVDWQRHGHLPVFSGSCKIYKWGKDDVFIPGKKEHPNGKVYNQGEDVTNSSCPTDLFFFPITDKHFVLIDFKQELYSRDKNGEIAFDKTPVQELQDAIFNSISLELSPAAQASYDKVKAEYGNMQLSKEFAPLKWPTEARTPGEPIPERSEQSVNQNQEFFISDR